VSLAGLLVGPRRRGASRRLAPSASTYTAFERPRRLLPLMPLLGPRMERKIWTGLKVYLERTP